MGTAAASAGVTQPWRWMPALGPLTVTTKVMRAMAAVVVEGRNKTADSGACDANGGWRSTQMMTMMTVMMMMTTTTMLVAVIEILT